MQSNKGRDTRPELAVRSAVHKRGLRFRVDARPEPELRRKADLLFPSSRVAVFVDGCFWHGCERHHTLAATNTDYWLLKVEENRKRDLDTNKVLTRAGWKVVRFWEHEDPEEVAATVEAIVRGHAVG